jgi:hypothetical protein
VRRRRSRRVTSPFPALLLVAAAVASACVTPATPAPSTAPTGVTAAPRPSPVVSDGSTFKIDADHARAVTRAVELIDAYNAGNLDAVLSLLADSVAAWGDCDGTAFVGVTRPTSKVDLVPMLRARFADHDHLEIGLLSNSNPDASSNRVVGIAFSRRSNDTLRALGFPDGIVGPQTNKTVFDSSFHVIAFASASSQQDCRLP